MPKLIVTSRYLKSGSGKKKQLYHYVKYIATREGSVPIDRKSTRLNSSHSRKSRMPSSA